MGNELTDAVADAGPIIHLSEIGALSCLQCFRTIHVPDAVWAETVVAERARPSALAHLSIERHTLSNVQVQQFVSDHQLTALHSGERECLYLCMRDSIAVLLTDDLAVREAAKRFNITPVGSLGAIVRAWRGGFISQAQARENLNALYEKSSLFVTRAIIELALEQLGWE